MIKKHIKRFLSNIDNNFKTSFYKQASKLLESWYSSNILNATRRNMNPAILNLKYGLGMKDRRQLKLHLGCGNRYIDGYVNIDWRKTEATDLVCDIRKLPYVDNSVELIESYHVIEHLPRHDLPKTLKGWRTILVPGGQLIIECPDFDESIKEYINGNEKRIDNIFGQQQYPGDTHLFGYNFKRLKNLLEKAGFRDIKNKEPQDYHSKIEPCLRVECVKGEKS